MVAASALHRTMTSPAALQEFRADFETVRAARATALMYTRFEDQHSQAGKGMKRTWKAALECGQALKRMHTSESYRDSYGSWTELCRALKVSREVSYRLMSYSEALTGLTPDSVANLPPMSGRRLTVFARATPEQKEEVVNESATTGDADAAFTKLRERLRAAPAQPLQEAEAPKQVNDEKNGLAWVKRMTTSLQRWFETRGLDAEAKAHLESLIQLAESVEVASPGRS